MLGFAAKSTRDEPGVSLRGLLAGSLVGRLTLTTCGLIVATCLVLSLVLVRRHLADIRHGLVDRGRAISEFVAREAELGVLSGDVAALRQLATVARAQPDVVYCRFFDRGGALLVSVGDDRMASRASLVEERPSDTKPLGGSADLWEFQAFITTTVLRPQPEELVADSGDEPEGVAPNGPREQIGTVSIGIALAQLHEQHRLALVTAGLFTLVVALLAVASAALLMHGTLRALASAADLAEERSRLAELKASFVTQASHEFRTPLAVILACSDALRRYDARMAPEQRNRRLAKIQGSVRHMTELLEDVLTLGRGDTRKLDCVREPVDVNAVCNEILADVQATAPETHRLILRSTGGGGEVMLDGKLVRQMLRNLLTNAVKYSPEGGMVWLELIRGDGAVTFRVTDQGIGIPPEDRKALFEPFHRGANVGKIPGSGLGLAITQQAVALHGGTIAVEGRPGGGTTFVVTLPHPPLPRESLAAVSGPPGPG
jgi:signal transduction histidine kinase